VPGGSSFSEQMRPRGPQQWRAVPLHCIHANTLLTGPEAAHAAGMSGAAGLGVQRQVVIGRLAVVDAASLRCCVSDLPLTQLGLPLVAAPPPAPPPLPPVVCACTPPVCLPDCWGGVESTGLGREAAPARSISWVGGHAAGHVVLCVAVGRRACSLWHALRGGGVLELQTWCLLPPGRSMT
jgi:hypothetical protein